MVANLMHGREGLNMTNAALITTVETVYITTSCASRSGSTRQVSDLVNEVCNPKKNVRQSPNLFYSSPLY